MFSIIECFQDIASRLTKFLRVTNFNIQITEMEWMKINLQTFKLLADVRVSGHDISERDRSSILLTNTFMDRF